MKFVITLRRNFALRCAVTIPLVLFLATNAPANPTGLTVSSGAASVSQSGSQLTITASQNAFLNWNTFNIAAGETTVFQQPSASSVVWNRVNDPNPSQIFGNLRANGVVVLLNSSGFYFGPNSFVSAAGLVVSTANCIPPENGGGTWEFNGPPPLASIINYGHIKVGNGGQAFLIADQIENHGTIEAPGGTIGLAAGQTVLLSERPDGRGMSLQVKLPQGSVDNFGNLIADAGTIALNAKVINQDGLLQANSVINQNGVIELVASDSLTLGASSQILAQGDGSLSGSAGGTVTLKSENNFSDTVGSQITVTGGAQGGNGGSIEVSAPKVWSLASSMDASAQPAATAGQFQLDSEDITLNSSGANGLNGSTLDLNVNGTFANFSQIMLQASGEASAGSGNITLTAGSSWNLGVDGGKLTLQANGKITIGNASQLIADGGMIGLYANVINQNGLIQANSLGKQHGTIELVAADQLTLGANSQIFANGDGSSSSSAGGQIMLQTPQTFSDAAGSQIQFHGANGGADGKVLIYAAQSSVNSLLNGSSAGSATGNIYYYTRIDNWTLTAGSLAPFAGFSSILFQANKKITISAGSVLDLSTGTSISSGQLTLQAGGDIVFASTTSQTAAITDPNNWKVTLEAGYNFGSHTVTSGTGNIFLNGGSGQTGGGYIKTAAGDINLTAGQSILVGKGYVNTTGGGDITAHALAGDIGTGTLLQGYAFQSASSASQGYYVDLTKGLGGISTAAGGDVSLTAGRDVFSLLPKASGATYNGTTVTTSGTDGTAGSGAYGNLPGQSGDVTIVAGRNVLGDYLVANGTGSIYAGVTMDANGNPVADASGNYVLGTTGSAGTTPSVPNLALNLINGGWNVTAAQNIILQEVRNPNGVFNTFNGSAAYHGFDYAANAYVNLTAGNLVQLGASTTTLPRVDALKVPAIYAPILNISAGAGGVVLVGDSTYNQLILYPSPEGSLTINTTQGGSLVGNLPAINGTPQIFNLIVSDSGRNQFTKAGQFGLNDHAAVPVHLNNSTPVTLNISGDMSLVLLGSPEAAQITVDGNLNNSRFQGMNLSSDPTQSLQVQVREIDGSIGMATVHPGLTSINVAGDIINRSAFTTVDLSKFSGTQAPDLSYLAQATTSDPSATTLAKSFYYDPVTQALTYQNIPGKSLASILTLLQNLPVQVYVNGVPQWADPPNNTIPVTTTVSVMNAQTSLALLAKYNADNIANGLPAGVGPHSSTSGLIMGGGGAFDITARNMDLGTTAGIQSKGVGLYTVDGSYPLAKWFNTGSDVSVNLAGNLNMYSTSIASLNGGDITVNVGGEVNAGSAQFTVNSIAARGIYSTSQGDVTVNALGNVNLNGSRIATYDGGNVSVKSANGNVDAGIGSSGYVIVQKYAVDPTSHAVTVSTATIPGSGLLATTFPDSSTPVGNILVESPNGDIIANSGGIVQLPLNGVKSPNATVTLLAGYELQNGTLVLVSPDRNINVSGSGVISQNASLKASGSINGLIFAEGNINVDAQQNVNVTALAQGTANVSAGGSVSGTIIAVGGISASGSSIDASLLSQNVSASGDTSGATQGFAQGTAANATSAAASNDTANQDAQNSTTGENSDDEKKKKTITLAKKVGRVTVLLPTKNN